MRLILIIISIITFSFVCFAQNDFQYSFYKIIGKAGNKNGEFNYPCCIDTDIYGNIYVSDWKNNRIQKFNKEGKFVISITGNDITNSKIYRPIGITVTSNDRLYVVDYGHHRVVIFNLNGKFISSFGKLGNKNGEFAYPRGIDKDSKNNVYIADFQNCRIQKFNFEGKFINSFKCRVAKSKKFYSPRSVCLDNKNNIYAIYSEYNIISKFSPNGKLLFSFGKKGSNSSEFINPRYISADAYNNIFITDWNNRVQIFSDKGKYLGVFTNISKAPFKRPEGISCDKYCNIYIADSENNRIQIFKSSELTKHRTQAMYYKINGYNDKLISEYEQIIKLDPSDKKIADLLKEYYLKIARKYKNSSQFKNAEKYYLKILILDPLNKEALEFKSSLISNKKNKPLIQNKQIDIKFDKQKILYGLIIILSLIILIILLTKPKKTKTVRKIRKKSTKNSSKNKLMPKENKEAEIIEGEKDDNIQ